MKIDVLHINSNYTYTNLHQCMLEKLDKEDEITNQVFMGTYNKSLGVVDPQSNVTVCECFKKWDRLFFYRKQHKIYKALRSNVDIDRFDVIHAYTLFTDGNCAEKISAKYGKPYVVAIRNTDVNYFFRLMPHLRSRGVKIMRNAKAIFFLSEAYREQVFAKYIPKKYHESLKANSYVIPNGIDDFWLNNSIVDNKSINTKNGVNLIYAGRIDKNKNIPTTQKAMEILRKQGYSVALSVVGKIQDEQEFQIIRKDPFTTYYPAMPKEKLIEIYRESDIFVMPSFTESFGLVYAEAMSQGLPVIYSKGQGFDNQFPEGTVGYHVDANDPESVADGIEKVINSFDAIRARTVISARRFNWVDISKRYIEIYRKL